jgi:DUF917 family protein
MSSKGFVSLLEVVALFLLVAASASAQQPKLHTLTEQELADMMLGAAIQSSRGDNTAVNVAELKKALAQGKKFQMLSLEDLPDDWTIVSTGDVGGGGAWPYVHVRTEQQKLPEVSIPYGGNVIAARELSKYTGKPIKAIIRNEADGATLEALLLSAEMGVPVVDACMAGRSVPDEQEIIPAAMGMPLEPSVLVSQWGDIVIIKKAADPFRFEDLARGLAVASGGDISCLNAMMSGRDAKRTTISGSLSQAIMLGRTAREALAQNQDPVHAVLKSVHGYKLFHGVVDECDTRGDRGFTWNVIKLEGVQEDAGHTYKIWNKNENIVTWYDGKVDATAPDTMTPLDPKTAGTVNGPTDGTLLIGAEVVMVGFRADPLWRTPKGIEYFGPRHEGFDFDYVPIEQLQKARNNPPVQ